MEPPAIQIRVPRVFVTRLARLEVVEQWPCGMQTIIHGLQETPRTEVALFGPEPHHACQVKYLDSGPV